MRGLRPQPVNIQMVERATKKPQILAASVLPMVGARCLDASRHRRAYAARLVSGALYGYNGWSVVTYISAEIKDPGRSIPRAIASAVVIVIALYTLVNAAYFFVLSPQAIASIAPTSSVAVELVRALFGPSFAGLAAAIVFASVTATLHVATLGYRPHHQRVRTRRDLLSVARPHVYMVAGTRSGHRCTGRTWCGASALGFVRCAEQLQRI